MEEFFGFAREEDPLFPVREETLGESAEPAPEPFGITVTGTFSAGLDTAREALVERLAGSDFPRSDVAPEQAVRRVGETLYVTGLGVADEEEDEGHPFVEVFEALGAVRVLVEGDRCGEGAIVVDMSARAPSEEAATDLADELADYWSLLYYMWARPPWHPLELSPDEHKARRTYHRLVTKSARRPFRDLLFRGSAGPDDHRELAALYRKRPLTLDPSKLNRWGEKMGRLTGPLPGGQQDTALCAATGHVRHEGERVDLAWINFTRFGAGFPAFLAYLWQAGCRDIRYDLVDFDDVRGD